MSWTSVRFRLILNRSSWVGAMWLPNKKLSESSNKGHRVWNYNIECVLSVLCLTRSWILQLSLCGTWCRPLYDAQFRVNPKFATLSVLQSRDSQTDRCAALGVVRSTARSPALTWNSRHWVYCRAGGSVVAHWEPVQIRAGLRFN